MMSRQADPQTIKSNRRNLRRTGTEHDKEAQRLAGISKIAHEGRTP